MEIDNGANKEGKKMKGWKELMDYKGNSRHLEQRESKMSDARAATWDVTHSR